jgi:hypothetical protein
LAARLNAAGGVCQSVVLLMGKYIPRPSVKFGWSGAVANGSGNCGNPCVRMHLANARAERNCVAEGGGGPPRSPIGAYFLQAVYALRNVREFGFTWLSDWGRPLLLGSR